MKDLRKYALEKVNKMLLKDVRLKSGYSSILKLMKARSWNPIK